MARGTESRHQDEAQAPLLLPGGGAEQPSLFQAVRKPQDRAWTFIYLTTLVLWLAGATYAGMHM